MTNNKKAYNFDNLSDYNSPIFINKMVQLFIKTTNEFLNNISIAIGEKNLLKITQLAHGIKPSIDLLNINSINQVIRKIENSSEINNELIDNISLTKATLNTVILQMQHDYSQNK